MRDTRVESIAIVLDASQIQDTAHRRPGAKNAAA